MFSPAVCVYPACSGGMSMHAKKWRGAEPSSDREAAGVLLLKGRKGTHTDRVSLFSSQDRQACHAGSKVCAARWWYAKKPPVSGGVKQAARFLFRAKRAPAKAASAASVVGSRRTKSFAAMQMKKFLKPAFQVSGKCFLEQAF